MQFMWLYIDDIVGKGLGLGLIFKLLFYLSISLFPLSLPIAILISSVMVMGNLAEKFELTSIKSSGTPLLRTMIPLIFLSAIAGVFSFLSSNYFLPVANLKYKSLMFDIRNHKPALSLDALTFNDDFQNIVIYFKEKASNDSDLKEVIIYDHEKERGKFSAMTAKTGSIRAAKDERYMIFELFEGEQIREADRGPGQKHTIYPVVRTKFKTWKKIFDLSEFDIDFTDENLFKSHQSMLSFGQLLEAIDSIQIKEIARVDRLGNFMQNFYFKDAKVDSLKQVPALDQAPVSKNKTKTPTTARKPYKQSIDRPFSNYKSITELFEVDSYRIWSKAKSNVRSVLTQIESTKTRTLKLRELRAKRLHEFHNRISMAAICIVFLFIGAPMGAIIRKGGFGYPLLVAIFYFMFYFILSIIFKKLTQTFVIHPALGAWMPVIILFPIGCFLTVKAMNDDKILDPDQYTQWIRKITERFRK